MKCLIGIVVLAIGLIQLISSSPIKTGGMVFYQPDYYNAHRAFVMQYASQPVRSYRRQGQASGVSAFASGKKISTGTFLRRKQLNYKYTGIIHWNFYFCDKCLRNFLKYLKILIFIALSMSKKFKVALVKCNE